MAHIQCATATRRDPVWPGLAGGNGRFGAENPVADTTVRAHKRYGMGTNRRGTAARATPPRRFGGGRDVSAVQVQCCGGPGWLAALEFSARSGREPVRTGPVPVIVSCPNAGQISLETCAPRLASSTYRVRCPAFAPRVREQQGFRIPRANSLEFHSSIGTHRIFLVANCNTCEWAG